ncbi:MaoC family dehydratase N-terminal domain-containing protein [Cellulomonas sp. NPDC057328]|uniref:FAS1-like dehydratase domain-containing protein n=1 Tax=Cellulomonas sp. NPDC057328 TaxID=3346101 RepID=UPI00362D2FA9
MAVDTTFAGRVYPPGDVYVVSREKIREFAEATGATHPAHSDVAAARALGHPDVVAPPTFAVVIAQRTEAAYVDDPAAGVDFSRVVHADERFTHRRPLHAGDRVVPTLHVDAVTLRGGLAMVTTRVEIADEAGAPVATVVSTLAVRPEEDA